MWWFISGGVLLLLGAICLFWAAPDYRRQKEAIKFLAHQTIADLLAIHATLRERSLVSLESLYERCSIAGVIERREQAPEPSSEGEPVLYKIWIEHKDASGEITRTSKRENWDTRFWVRDDTGSILVDPLSATIELFRAQTFENEQELRTEQALRVGQPVYILGWLSDFHGQPIIINKGSSGADIVNTHYVITWRSRQLMAEEARSSWLTFLWMGPILGLIGVVLIVIGFVS